MQETISMPGVYSSEVNQTFNSPIQLPDGCAIIGPTQKGEAYVPTSVQSLGQFSAIFGTDTSTSYVPQTVYNYLQAGDSISVTRVLGNGGFGYTPQKSLAAVVKKAVNFIAATTASVSIPTASLLSSLSGSNQQVIALNGATNQYFYGYNPTPVVVPGSVVNDVQAVANIYVNGVGGVGSNISISADYDDSMLASYTQTSANISVVDVANSLVGSINSNTTLNYTASLNGNVISVKAAPGEGASLNNTSFSLISRPETIASGSFIVPSNSPNSFILSDGIPDSLAISQDCTGMTQTQIGAWLSSELAYAFAYSGSYNTGSGNLVIYAPIGVGASGNNISLSVTSTGNSAQNVRLSGGVTGTVVGVNATAVASTNQVPKSGTNSIATAKVLVRDQYGNTIDTLGSYVVLSSDTPNTIATNLAANINSVDNKGYGVTAKDNTITVAFKSGYGNKVNNKYDFVIQTVTTNLAGANAWANYQGGNQFKGGTNSAPQLPISVTPFTGGVTANTGSLQVRQGNTDTQALGSIYFVNTGSISSQITNLVSSINAYTPLTQITGSISAGKITLASTATGAIYNSYVAGPAPTGSGIIPTAAQSQFAGGLDQVDAVPGGILAVLHPSHNQYPSIADLNNSSVSGTPGNLNLTISGNQVNQAANVSIFPTDSNYLPKVLGTDANASTGGAFAYLNFVSSSVSNNTPIAVITQTGNCTFTSSYSEGYDAASTPWLLSDANARLFQFVHRSHGFSTNKDVKVAIANIKVNPSDTIYTTFDVLVRQYGDTDKTPVILEQYTQVTLNPNATNYIGLAIGDRYNYYDKVNGKVVSEGNFDNISSYIRVVVSDIVAQGNIVPNTSISGHENLLETIAGFGDLYRIPAATYTVSNSGSYIYSGFDYANVDNTNNYLNPVPLEAQPGNNSPFTLPSNDNKFILPFQGGTDGMSYATIKNIGDKISNDGTNVFGYDLSSSNTAGYTAFAQAIDILSNKQLHKYGILVIPGIIQQYHGAVTEYAQAMVESRGDAVYLRDLTGVNETVPTAISVASGLNSSYSATYYPWVKVIDIGSSKAIYVPPTVYVPQVIAYSDKVSAPWYAPAGTGRGTIGGAIDTKNRLTNAEGGALYNAKINPLMKAPNTGVVIMGQKTLQQADNDLNRLNVRRLLITLKDYIGNIANDLVFEQNVNATRNAFLAKINPYLQSVQSGKGIVAFKTTCDATNNSSTDTARHILNCKIQIIPAESIEFVLLEFDLTPQGATFA